MMLLIGGAVGYFLWGCLAGAAVCAVLFIFGKKLVGKGNEAIDKIK